MEKDLTGPSVCHMAGHPQFTTTLCHEWAVNAQRHGIRLWEDDEPPAVDDQYVDWEEVDQVLERAGGGFGFTLQRGRSVVSSTYGEVVMKVSRVQPGGAAGERGMQQRRALFLPTQEGVFLWGVKFCAPERGNASFFS